MNDDLLTRIQCAKEEHHLVSGILKVLLQRIEEIEEENKELKSKVDDFITRMELVIRR